MNFSIIIPNWNGCQLLKKNLPAVAKAGAREIIITDDESTDGSIEFLRERYPKIKVVSHPHLGFAGNCNLGVKEANGEIIVLLNSDVAPDPAFLNPLKEDFSNEKVFAVSLNEPQWSWAKFNWINGFVEHNPGQKTQKTHISFWANGGSSAFRKELWEKFGGFDEIYQPFYWEDIDLSYRAWKRGYKIIWDSRSVVHHHHEGTIGANFDRKYIDFISQRNQLIFIWKNITDGKMIKEHRCYLIRRLIKNPGYGKVLLATLFKLPKLLPKRRKEISEEIISDRKILAMFQ